MKKNPTDPQDWTIDETKLSEYLAEIEESEREAEELLDAILELDPDDEDD